MTSTLTQAIEKLELLAGYNFTCVAGTLIHCQDYVEAMALLRGLRGYHAPE